ncbi:MAG: hypothetical protein IPL79_20305 [Myxococcales bacterium]|nr:hypothetical protein [Myxococcales bacterium]
MTAGTDIAAEIAAALAEAGEATGSGALVCTIKRASGGPVTPWDTGAATAAYFEVTALADEQRLRDINGTLIGQTVRTLMVDATGTVPLKSDVIAVGIRAAAVDANTEWAQILEVRTTAPGGVALYHELDLAK